MRNLLRRFNYHLHPAVGLQACPEKPFVAANLPSHRPHSQNHRGSFLFLLVCLLLLEGGLVTHSTALLLYMMFVCALYGAAKSCIEIHD